MTVLKLVVIAFLVSNISVDNPALGGCKKDRIGFNRPGREYDHSRANPAIVPDAPTQYRPIGELKLLVPIEGANGVRN